MKFAQRLTMRGQGGGGDPFWSDVLLLIQPPDDAEHGSTTITDRSPYGRDVSRNGATVSTSLGDPFVYYDGTDDYLNVGHDTVFNGTSGLTVESIFRTSNVSLRGFGFLVNKRSYPTDRSWQLYYRSNGSLSFWCHDSSGVSYNAETASGVLQNNVTYHAMGEIDESLVLRLWLDGTFVGKASLPSVGTNTMPVRIGSENWQTPPSYEIIGHQITRITGAVRIGADVDFTPPTRFPVG